MVTCSRWLLIAAAFVLASHSAHASPFFMGLGDLPGGSFNSEAESVSADGSVVVGRGRNANDDNEAFLWNGSMVGLGTLGSNDESQARSVSADGMVVVGVSGGEAFRWEDQVMEGLGDLAGGSFQSMAFGVSDDGSVIVGLGNSDDGQRAFVWDQDTGMRSIQDILEDHLGIDLSGWELIAPPRRLSSHVAHHCA